MHNPTYCSVSNLQKIAVVIRKLILFVILGAFIVTTNAFSKTKNEEIQHAEILLNQIFKLYDAGYDHLLNETYPYNSENKATYLAGEDKLNGKRVAYLWPTSGVFSGVNALLKFTGNEKYSSMLDEQILPGLQHYFDETREPFCYQSYITEAAESDRYYDDNIWLAIDFCESYQMTHKQEYLKKSVQLWQFIISGWDEKLDGGIYWCEQKRQSKNTCSNAPASVLAFQLFEATGDSAFFNRGIEIYNWTKQNLQDSTDYLYFDNKKLDGKVDQRKYTYNSGQMLHAAALLYKHTGNKEYLDEAQKIVVSAIEHFTVDFTTPEGKTIRLFKNTGNWFNVILFRGVEELYFLDNNSEYVEIFKDNLEYLWNHLRDENGLFGKDWKGEKQEKYKWLLDQASLVELYARLGEITQRK